MPPAFGFHPATPKEDRDRQIAHDAAAIVKPQVVERVGAEAACQETTMIVLEQWPLELTASTGIPMQRHEEGQIACPEIQVPELPVDQKSGALARAGKEKVPGVCVAVSDGERPRIGEAQPRLQ